MGRNPHDQRDVFDVAPGWLVVDPPGAVGGPIDRVAVGFGGVLALVRWHGAVTVADGVLHQDGRRRELQAADLVAETAALAAVLAPPHRSLVAPVVVTAGDDAPQKVHPGLVLIGADLLGWTTAGLGPRLGPDDVADVVGRIAQARHRRVDDLPTQKTLSALFDADRAARR